MVVIIPNENELYDEYIERILNSRENIKDNENYQEIHHILPRCMGGEDNKENLIYLYAQEHYYAHKLLALENPENNSLQYAWWMMSQYSDSSENRHYHITAEDYQIVRERFSRIHSNREIKETTRNKLSEAHKGKFTGEEHWNYGNHRPQTTKEKISQARKGKYCGELNSHAKKVICLETGQIFNTMKEAADFAGVKLAAISNNCNGWSKKVKNKYTFKIYTE